MKVYGRDDINLQFCLSVPSELIMDVKRKARRLDVPANKIINRALVEYLRHHPVEDEEVERKIYHPREW